ncbi:winged helix-turn-helix domain-containing protein [Arthrobacter dokdonensis]|uniref:winged helix-turn-helix domain-containing protein n=1 Tax=Arthrobacter dokdonellae TaxID=2211210 RepID=UPI001D13105D|nr:winged helix-turn-helix domain-containing protein [Arthrobacter dokdonellae]
MRFATREGKYPRPRSAPPPISRALPFRPVAVMVHGVDGSVATLCLDLDTSKALQAVVDADAAAIGALLGACGLRFVADHSPSGGRHLYVPLAERLPAGEARELVEALGARFPSLDAGPHQNVTDGCIRPPGSMHKSGNGHQVLDTPLAEAYDVLRRRNPPEAVAALRKALAAPIRQVRARAAAAATTAARRQAAHIPGAQALAGAGSPAAGAEARVLAGSVLRQVARTGIYDTHRYASDSEARMAVLNHLCAWQLGLAEVQARLDTDFAGLAALYGTAARRERLLPTEWANAAAWVGQKQHPPATGAGHGNKSDTEPSLTHGGGPAGSRSRVSVLAEINDLENVLYSVLDQRLARTGREGIMLRFLIRAVLGFARAKETLLVDVGCRAFALAMGAHHGTVARLLPRLVRFSGGMLGKVEDARGKRADSYLLGCPEQWRDVAAATAWRKGKIHGIRPVFRALGAPAALVYEAVERGRHCPTTAEIVRATGMSRPTVAKELAALAELAMVERREGSWRVVAATNLGTIAGWLGVQEDYEAQLRLVKAQRRQWHAHLERHMEQEIREEDLFDAERDEYDPWDPGLAAGGQGWAAA